MRCRVSCNSDPFLIAGEAYEPLPCGEVSPFGRPVTFTCPDCGTPPGGIDHHGCEVERCPACRRQAITCRCGERDEWDEQDEWDQPQPQPNPNPNPDYGSFTDVPRYDHGLGPRPSLSVET